MHIVTHSRQLIVPPIYRRFDILLRIMRTVLLGLVACLAFAEDYFPAPDSAGGWRTLTDAAKVRKNAGIDTHKLDMAFEYAKRTSPHGGLLVVRHGYLVYERYYGRGNREANPSMASVGKAYASIACGIMLKEKHDQIPLGLEQKVFTEKYLPEALPLSDPSKADIKLGHLLTMSSGMQEGTAGFVDHVFTQIKPMPPRDPKLDPFADQDLLALRAPLWCSPGGGYTYSSQSTHVATIVLRHLVGMELQDYVNEKLAKPMEWGRWSWARTRGGKTLPHTPGGGDVAVRSTDALRFAYLLLHQGRWGKQQLVPADYVALCSRPSPYDPHAPFSLMFEVNADGHVAGAPSDAFFKSGAGGFGIYVIPSLDMVIYKMSGNTVQYDPANTGLPLAYQPDASRDGWKPEPHSQFYDGPVGVDDGVRRVLEMVVAAVVE
jgi:CubicO group peptidase (beta-lactamase class C family)